MCEFIAQKNGVTTLVTGARHVGQSGGKVTAGTQSLPTQPVQKPWPHGATMHRSEAARGHSSKQTAHVNLQSSLAFAAAW